MKSKMKSKFRAGVDGDDARGRERGRPPARNSNIQSDVNVRVRDRFDASSASLLRELNESNRFVQKSAESTSI